MHLTDYIKNRKGKPLLSLELIPPEKGKSIDEIYQTMDTLMAFTPTFVSVTSHAHERSIQILDKKRILRIKKKRLDTNAICLELRARYGIEPIPHIIGAGFTRDETEDALYTLNFHRIDNVLALRGDFPKNEKYRARSHGYLYASDMVEQIKNLNKGIYIDQIDNAIKMSFCIGVAGYPEGHPETQNLKKDLNHLEAKIDNGADFIITQMFFNNDYYFRFVDALRKRGINLPVIPGIKPLYTKKQLTSLPAFFHVVVPKRIVKEMEKYELPSDVRKAGVAHTIKQCEDLIKNDVPCLHFYTRGRSDPTANILGSITEYF